MTNTNISFITTNELKNNIAQHTIVDSSQMLIQFFCANTDKTFIAEVQELIKSKFPKSVLIGTTTVMVKSM